ncbi:MAG: J domain-containing protein [Smithellaceae bacterium]
MKKKALNNEILVIKNKNQNICLSCGTADNMKNRKYCSIRCRQNLRQKLNTRSGLLEVLNTRYATFYFSDTSIIMDILPRGYKEIFRYKQMRTSGLKPSDDFSKMANVLGNVWWKEEERTNKKYLASRRVLELATRHAVSLLLVRPAVIKVPAVKTESLNYLKIDKSDLRSADLRKIIKNAYRSQAKIHHPDSGGHGASFRNLHEAYKELLHWAESPSFICRRGFPDKWFYDGENKKWVQPMPVSK